MEQMFTRLLVGQSYYLNNPRTVWTDVSFLDVGRSQEQFPSNPCAVLDFLLDGEEKESNSLRKVVPEVQSVTGEGQEAAMIKAIIQSKVRQIRRWLKLERQLSILLVLLVYFYLLQECRMLNARVSPPHFHWVHLVLSWHKKLAQLFLAYFHSNFNAKSGLFVF